MTWPETWFDLAMVTRPLELVLMAAIFLGSVWRVLSPRRRRQYEESALIPLRDDRPGRRG